MALASLSRSQVCQHQRAAAAWAPAKHSAFRTQRPVSSSHCVSRIPNRRNVTLCRSAGEARVVTAMLSGLSACCAGSSRPHWDFATSLRNSCRVFLTMQTSRPRQPALRPALRLQLQQRLQQERRQCSLKDQGAPLPSSPSACCWRQRSSAYPSP